MRVQRTRSSASPPHSPLTRGPLGDRIDSAVAAPVVSLLADEALLVGPDTSSLQKWTAWGGSRTRPRAVTRVVPDRGRAVFTMSSRDSVWSMVVTGAALLFLPVVMLGLVLPRVGGPALSSPPPWCCAAFRPQGGAFHRRFGSVSLWRCPYLWLVRGLRGQVSGRSRERGRTVGSPNTRVQRTRSSASPPHSPLTRRLLGALGGRLGGFARGLTMAAPAFHSGRHDLVMSVPRTSRALRRRFVALAAASPRAIRWLK